MYFWLQNEKSQVRKEVKSQLTRSIDKKFLVHLKFTKQFAKTELNWEHSKEFGYKGEMYDVIETLIVGDTINYWCWWDNEETNLNKKLNNLVAQALGNNHQNKENEKQLTNFFKTLFHENTPAINIFSVFLNKTKIPPSCSFYRSRCSSPSVPPPQIV